jgi:DNA polymerase I-like protein with 3'-5' exonuclease and polymerase domains/uracil-DNA glycosylase
MEKPLTPEEEEDLVAAASAGPEHAAAMAMGARCAECPLRGCGGPVPSELNPSAFIAAIGKHPKDVERKHNRPACGPAGKAVKQALGTVNVPEAHVAWINTVGCQPPANDLKRVTARVERLNAKAKRLYAKTRKAWVKEKQKAAKKGHLFTMEPPAPPKLTPTPAEACRPRLVKELAAYSNLMPMGTDACKNILGRHASVMKVRGGMVEGALTYDTKENAITVLNVDETDPLPGPQYRRVRVLPIMEPGYVLRFPRWTKSFYVDIGRAAAWFRDTLQFILPVVVHNPPPAVLAVFLRKEGAVYAYDVETDGIESLSASLRCIAIGDAHTVMVMGFRSKDLPPVQPSGPPRVHGVKQTSFAYSEEDTAAVLDLIKEWLLRPDRVKVGHNAGVYDYCNVLTQLGIRPVNTLDTLQLHKLVEAELPHNLGFVASVYAPAVKSWKSDRDGRKIALEAESDEELAIYCGMDVALTARVLPSLLNAVEVRGQGHLIAKDHKVQHICARMHEMGMYVDKARRAEHENALVTKAVTLRKELRALTGAPDFNPNSRDQLAALWFETWKLEHPPSLEMEDRYTPSGAFSVNDTVVRALLSTPHLTPQQRETLLTTRKYKKAQKVLGTYVAKLRTMNEFVEGIGWDDDEDVEEAEYRKRYNVAKKGVTWPDGRVRPGYNNLTAVGRLNSGKPMNAQNFPRWLRDMVVARPGHVLVGADADQFHIRIFAAMWGVKMYLKAFDRGACAHSMTALACFPDSNKAGRRFRQLKGFTGGKWDGDYYIPDGTGDWEGDAKKVRDLSKRTGFASYYAAGISTVWNVIQSAENKAGDLIYLDLATREVRTMHGALMAAAPEIKLGWANEQALFDAYGYLVEPVDGRRRDFLDGPTKQDLANYRTLGAEAALMTRAMIKATDAIPWGKWGVDTGLMTMTHDSMVFEVPDDGVWDDGGTLRAKTGTPAWETMEILREVLNYDGASVGLDGVQFTSTPSLGRTWAQVG